jgi:hypothetical protein
MKNKLKFLFAYFRGFKTSSLITHINIEYHTIEDWDQKYITQEEKGVYALDSINQMLEEVVELYNKDFDIYNNYQWDSYWTLMIEIFPFENRINFKSECKLKVFYNKKSEFSLDPKNKNFIGEKILDKINIVFEEELIGKDQFHFTFDGDNDQIDINFYYAPFDEDLLADLADIVMIKIQDNFWMDNGGVYGEMTIKKGESLILDWVLRDFDYKMTKMDINITPENFK